MKHKLNKKLIIGEKGFNWSIRYSQTDDTDDMGRWARIGYYNGLCISWINGFVKQGEMPKLDNRRIGKCNYFIVTLYFPISSAQVSGCEKFDNIKDAKKYAEQMFISFKKFISTTEA